MAYVDTTRAVRCLQRPGWHFWKYIVYPDPAENAASDLVCRTWYPSAAEQRTGRHEHVPDGLFVGIAAVLTESDHSGMA